MISGAEQRPDEIIVLNTAEARWAEIEAHPTYLALDAFEQDAVKQWFTVGVDAGYEVGYDKGSQAHVPTPERRLALLNSSARLLETIETNHLLDSTSLVSGGQTQTLGQGE